MKWISPAKTSCVRKDIIDWSQYLCSPSKWPSVLPIRSVLALQVAICNENVTNAIYRAAWMAGEQGDSTTSGVI
ncbi:unnamed protein product [Sphagnum troendelagicum]